MTPTNKKWIEKRLAILNPEKTLEIGSLDVNGRIERQGDWLGIDMREGPNVDRVMNAHHLDHSGLRVDCVVCCDMLEHDDAPWRTADCIFSTLVSKGAAIVTVPGIGFKRHDFPSDYWRFTRDGLRVLFNQFFCVELVEDTVEHAVRGVFQR